MKKLSFIIKVMTISLVIVVLTNSIGYSIMPTIAHAQANCGEWIIENLGSTDQRISVKRLEKAKGNDCSGEFTLYNQTGIVISTNLGDISLGGYSFELLPTSNNANFEFSPYSKPILILGDSINIKTTPLNIAKVGNVGLQSEITKSSVSFDLSLFLLQQIIKSLSADCVTQNQVIIISLRTYLILENAVRLLFEGKMLESISEFLRVGSDFRNKVEETALEIGATCLADKLIKGKLDLIEPYLTWSSTTLFDYIKYNGLGGPLVLLSYVPPIPPTPTPVPIPLLPETIMFDTRSSAAKSSIILVNGHQYSIKISGTYSYWEVPYWKQYGTCAGTPDSSPMFSSSGVTNGLVGQDAYYFFSFPKGPGSTDICGKRNPPFFVGFIELSTDGGNYSVPKISGFNKSHIYEFHVLGMGKALSIKFNDSYYQDNYGQLKIEITP